MSLRPIFERKLIQAFSPRKWSDDGLLVAFSGGPDSTALLAALAAVQEPEARLAAAHFNHRLRGPESDADQRHAAEIARTLNVHFETGEADVAAVARHGGDGIEAAARSTRYDFLIATAARLGLRYVATGHTLDDQAETVLHRIVRGTGIAGLAGMAPARPAAGGTIGVVRPLLGVRRTEVLEYLADRGLDFVVDASNEDRRYTRNRLRHELLPQLAAVYNPQVVESLVRLAAQAGEIRDLVHDLIQPVVKRATIRIDAEAVEINCRAFQGVPRHLVRETIVALWRSAGWPEQAMGYDEWDALATMALDADAESPKRTLPGGVIAERCDMRLTWRRTNAPTANGAASPR